MFSHFLRRAALSLCCFFAAITISLGQSSFTIAVKGHPDAVVSFLGKAVKEMRSGDLDRNQNVFTATKPGYKPLIYTPLSKRQIKDYLKAHDTETFLLAPFDTRTVELTTAPYDAEIFVNGERKGTQNYLLEIPLGKTMTVELKKKGFQTEKRTYAYLNDNSLPVAKDRLELNNRVVKISTNLLDARIIVNGQEIGKGNAAAVVPNDECVVVTASKEGFVPVDYKFCNRSEDVNKPPFSYNLNLKDRLVRINTSPETASIKVDGKVMEQGKFEVKVPDGHCVEVIVQDEGYEYVKKVYCNQEQYAELEAAEHIVLREDEAYLSSAQVDQANIDIAVDVNENRTKEEAWQLLSMIVTSHFDVLEITDENTGYIRTSWVLNPFAQNTIRTRLIVKQSSVEPLQFKVKLQSQQSGRAQTSVKNDHEFKDWDRILNTYKDIFSELQARLIN